jgi:hypothetical protein
VKIDPASQDDVRAVAGAMRERDFAEFSAVSWRDGRDALAEDLAARYGGRPDVLCGFHAGAPACIGGTIEARPNVLTMLFFATDDFPRIAFPVTRFIRGELFPRYRTAGVHRIEAVSMDGHDDAHRWLRTLGFEQEGPPMKGYGKGGEAFISFAVVW